MKQKQKKIIKEVTPESEESNDELESELESEIESDTENNKLKVLDLFCGCGGMTTGLIAAGLEVVAGVDIWGKAIESYKSNHDHLAICADLTKFPPEKIKKKYNISNIDVLVGGPPCQGFSLAGKRDKRDPRNSLFIEFCKYLNFFKPKVFIMENVIGILSMKTKNGEKVIDIIMSFLERDYDCCINKLYAADFEVPQLRRRTIIIGVRKDLKIRPKEIKPFLKKENRIPVRSVLEGVNDVDKRCFLSKRAIDGINRKLEKSRIEGKGFGAQFLKMNEPSYTIPARYWKDGYDALVKYSNSKIRRLTVKELKRIQTLPDDYVIKGTKRDIIVQIGNAVACRFAYHLGKYITSLLQ